MSCTNHPSPRHIVQRPLIWHAWIFRTIFMGDGRMSLVTYRIRTIFLRWTMFLLPSCNSYSLVVPSLCSCCVAPLHLFCLYMWILGSSLILNFPCFSWLKVVVESSSFQGCPDKQPTSNCRVIINQSEKCHLFMHCRVAIDDTDTYTCYLYFCVLLCCDRGRLHIKRRELKI